ncbi:MAG: hypothetical protein HGA96_15545 [Desulfobulbaceae bacterium]|nr:hypothetical protein [Desulfobulbaceae bacterium]
MSLPILNEEARGKDSSVIIPETQYLGGPGQDIVVVVLGGMYGGLH